MNKDKTIHLYITALLSLRLAIKFEETQDITVLKSESPYDDIFDKIMVEVVMRLPGHNGLSLDNLTKIISAEELYICKANDWNFYNPTGVDFLEHLIA